MLDRRERIVERVQQLFPCLVLRRLPESNGVILQRLPANEQHVPVAGFQAATRVVRTTARHRRDDGLGLPERALECGLASGDHMRIATPRIINASVSPGSRSCRDTACPVGAESVCVVDADGMERPSFFFLLRKNRRTHAEEQLREWGSAGRESHSRWNRPASGHSAWTAPASTMTLTPGVAPGVADHDCDQDQRRARRRRSRANPTSPIAMKK